MAQRRIQQGGGMRGAGRGRGDGGGRRGGRGGNGGFGNEASRVAVPASIGTGFDGAPPGHRFRLYVKAWTDTWGAPQNKKSVAEWGAKVSEEAKRGTQALRERQQALLARAEGGEIFHITGQAISPLAIGTGNEHPLENGLTFADPHGLPYVPGSAIKGVVRRAAEELALLEHDSKGWDIVAVWQIFGFEASSAYFQSGRWAQAYTKAASELDSEVIERIASVFCLSTDEARGALKRLSEEKRFREQVHMQGAVEFWDCHPVINRDLHVDVMNPHFPYYYQGREPPTDSQSPKPIYFLTVPEGVEYLFVGQRAKPLQGLEDQWQQLLEAAFEHAFDWLGFGAKTAAGYGAMKRANKTDQEITDRRRRRREEQAQQERAQEEARRREEERREYEAFGRVGELMFELKHAEEPRIHALLDELHQFEGKDQKRLAAALKEAYERIGKWSGSLSKKQKPKVQRIKQILEEP